MVFYTVLMMLHCPTFFLKSISEPIGSVLFYARISREINVAMPLFRLLNCHGVCTQQSSIVNSLHVFIHLQLDALFRDRCRSRYLKSHSSSNQRHFRSPSWMPMSHTVGLNYEEKKILTHINKCHSTEKLNCLWICQIRCGFELNGPFLRLDLN